MMEFPPFSVLIGNLLVLHGLLHVLEPALVLDIIFVIALCNVGSRATRVLFWSTHTKPAEHRVTLRALEMVTAVVLLNWDLAIWTRLCVLFYPQSILIFILLFNVLLPFVE